MKKAERKKYRGETPSAEGNLAKHQKEAALWP